MSQILTLCKEVRIKCLRGVAEVINKMCPQTHNFYLKKNEYCSNKIKKTLDNK